MEHADKLLDRLFASAHIMLADWETLAAIVIAVVAAIIAGLIVHRIVFAFARRLAQNSDNLIDDAILRHIRSPTRLAFSLIALFLVLPSLQLQDDLRTSFERLLSLGFTGVFGWAVIGVTGVLADIVKARYDIHCADNLQARQMHTRIHVLRRIAVTVIVIVTTCLILMSIPSIRQIGVTLFASAGLIGLVAGMAARPLFSNLIAGIQLAFTEPIRLDDVVIIEGEWGWIEEIRPTYVVVRIWDLRRLIVPLSKFIEEPFQNWTRQTADLLGTVIIYADYSLPVDAVRRQLLTILQESDMWDGQVWGLQVTGATERTVELRALMSASNSGLAWDLRCHVREALISHIQQTYPHCLPRVRAELEPEPSHPAKVT